MKTTVAWLMVAFVVLGGLMPALAADLKDKVKVEISSVGLHPGMDPGMYVCALGHLHIKGTVEFLTITGPLVQQVKRHEVAVVEAPSKQ